MNHLRTMILGLLHRRLLYGYQIRATLRQDDLLWANLPVASLYPELEKMADEGLVGAASAAKAPSRPGRCRYRLAPKGQEELQRALREAWGEIPGEQLSQDVALFLIDALPHDEVAGALRRRLGAQEERLQGLQGAPLDHPAAQSGPPALAAIREHTRLLLQAELEWTRHLLDRLEAGAFAQAPAPQAEPKRSAKRQRKRAPRGRGAFTFVLHSHLPYCRLAGRWPHGEEWIHEAAAETYVPLLNALYDLREESVDYRLTLSVTPILAEQLADADVSRHFVHYLDEEIEAAERDIPRFGELEDAHLEYLARFYHSFYTQVRDSYLGRFGGNLVAALRELQDEGYVEIITSAATHGYLPLLARDSSIYAQLRTGADSYRRHFGRAPRAAWLPECAYRPAYIAEDGTVRPALEEFLAGLGIACFFAETHAIEGGRPVGKAAGDVAIGPYSAVKRPYVIPFAEQAGPGGSTFEAYYVVGSSQGLTEPPVAAIGRNDRTGRQVWSGDWGYPGDGDYREFHKKDDQSGLQYWRVTGPRVDLGAKDYYHPDWAQHKVREHAQHFAALVEQLLGEYHAQSGRYGLIAANYDTELFGHWWFEGIDWIKEVLRLLASSKVVDLTTASAFLAENKPERIMAIPESSWGVGGTHWTWDNPDTAFIWPLIHEAEQRMEHLVELYPQAEGDALVVLNQAARELLLLESSDWPFLVTTGQAKQYALDRFHSHLARFRQLADMAEAGITPQARARAEELLELDKVFPDLDYRWFKACQGKANQA
jgi:1,4-alpha-glucan branching enzyme